MKRMADLLDLTEAVSTETKNIYMIPKKHISAPNLKSRYRSAVPRKQRTVAILAVMATRKHRQRRNNGEITSHPRKP